MIWRHADVDDGQIRSALANDPDQLRPVARPADDLVPAPLEQARDALAHQHVIVGDDDSRAARIDFGHGESIPQHDRRNQAKARGKANCPPPIRTATGSLAGRWVAGVW